MKSEHRIPLLTLVTLAQSYPPGVQRDAVMRMIIRQHGGLGKLMMQQFGRHLEYAEQMGYLWEGLTEMIESWNPAGKWAPSTHWKYATMTVVREHQHANCYVGGVHIPWGQRKEYVAADIDAYDLESQAAIDAQLSSECEEDDGNLLTE